MCKIRKMQRQCGIYIFFFFSLICLVKAITLWKDLDMSAP